MSSNNSNNKGEGEFSSTDVFTILRGGLRGGKLSKEEGGAFYRLFRQIDRKKAKEEGNSVWISSEELNKLMSDSNKQNDNSVEMAAASNGADEFGEKREEEINVSLNNDSRGITALMKIMNEKAVLWITSTKMNLKTFLLSAEDGEHVIELGKIEKGKKIEINMVELKNKMKWRFVVVTDKGEKIELYYHIGIQ